MLRSLSKEKMGDLIRKTKEAYKLLCAKQQCTSANPTTEAIREETIAYARWQRLAELEEEFLKQRSKTHWLDVGDGNNKFFHNAVKTREMRNAIREIRCGDGSIARTDEEIKVEAVRSLKNLCLLNP